MTINWQLALPCAVAVSSIIVNGCTTLFADQGQVHVGDSLNIYAPFDNSRDRGRRGDSRRDVSAVRAPATGRGQPLTHTGR